MTTWPPLPHAALERVERLLAAGGRCLLGLVGPPGGGKSTLATALHAAFPERSVVVPMDGFHLANVELQRLGRAARKGAFDTFDAAGYVALLQRLRTQGADETVYAPLFRREIEESIAGAIAVPPQVPLVITEGNWLLLDAGPWSAVRGLLDEAWYVAVDDTRRVERLVRRHRQFGRSEAEARAWVRDTDAPNAVLVEATRARADLVLRWPDEP